MSGLVSIFIQVLSLANKDKGVSCVGELTKPRNVGDSLNNAV
jgi:hypothetical protein